jgi:hypothetical protein
MQRRRDRRGLMRVRLRKSRREDIWSAVPQKAAAHLRCSELELWATKRHLHANPFAFDKVEGGAYFSLRLPCLSDYR